MNSESQKVLEFRVQLQKLDADFVCSSVVPSTSVAVSFLGPFMGRIVLWSMTLSTMDQFRLVNFNNVVTKNADSLLHPFIEIEAGCDGIFPLHVVLALETIDDPVIRKTIIMIRNYKRLRVGKIEFGNADA